MAGTEVRGDTVVAIPEDTGAREDTAAALTEGTEAREGTTVAITEDTGAREDTMVAIMDGTEVGVITGGITGAITHIGVMGIIHSIGEVWS